MIYMYNNMLLSYKKNEKLPFAAITTKVDIN